MKKSLLRLVVVLSLAGAAMAGPRTVPQGGGPSIFAPPVTPAGPLVGVVNAMVTAFNNQDRAYFQKMIAPDAIWFDEDGHHMAAGVWMNRILSATAPRKLTISNLRVANWDTAGWAGFNYVVDETGRQLKGTNTLFFKKNGNDWQIVVIHGAIDTFAGAH